MIILTDGSVDPQSQLGFGAYLAIPGLGLSLTELQTRIKIRRFEQTSSTQLELQTVIWALHDQPQSADKLTFYSDSQNIISLLDRRRRLERNNYRAKSGKRLKHAELYQEFFRLTDQRPCEFIKLQGHQTSQHKNAIDQLFTLVDRASRKALRDRMASSLAPRKKPSSTIRSTIDTCNIG